jgi:PAS domain S-box-containing protein
VASFELNRFLADIETRRERLIGVAGSEADRESAALDELAELGEHLIAADEELRVQQEELDRARETMAIMALDRDVLLDSSPTAYVLTDDRGVVLRANRSAYQLAQQPATRRIPRPIATWFVVPDRARVRAMIGRLRNGATEIGQEQVVVRRPDDTTAPVVASVAPVIEASTSRMLMRWELNPLSGSEPSSTGRGQTVSQVRALSVDPESLTAALAAMAEKLSKYQTVDAVLTEVLTAALDIVPDAARAVASFRDPRAVLDTSAYSDEVALQLERSQALRREGPTVDGLTGVRVRVDDLEIESRWPLFREQARDLGVRSIVVAPFPESLRPSGALVLSADAPYAFDEQTESALSALAVHAGVALQRVRMEGNLRRAVDSRQVIGTAVGILVERHRSTEAQAFERLVRVSQQRNIKLSALAARLLETGEEPESARMP